MASLIKIYFCKKKSKTKKRFSETNNDSVSDETAKDNNKVGEKTEGVSKQYDCWTEL